MPSIGSLLGLLTLIKVGNIITIKSLLPTRQSFPSVDKTYVGIDFGTSTTVASIAYFDRDSYSIKVDTIPIEQKMEDGAITTSLLVPSVIALYNNRLLVGEGASYLKYTLPRNEWIWYSFKMELGEGIQYYNSKLASANEFTIVSPKDATSVFFMYLKGQIMKYCESKGISTNIEYAVSIPASFEANQRKDLVEAIERNGMQVSRQSLIDEPNAAFLSYIQESVSMADDNHRIVVQNSYNPKVLVFDFGGGTCDISILEIGKGANGFYSKNLSISKFSKLGGDDIDRYIAYHYLMPQLFKANGKTKDDFRTPDKRHIALQLMKIAEQLKVLICKDIANMMGGMNLPALKDSDMAREVNLAVKIDTKRGTLEKEGFSLRYKDFTEVMNVFTKSDGDCITRIKGEDEYNSIYSPLKSALEKAHIDKDRDLDYVLFIGGSSKNPYIQSALSEFFSESELLIPSDLQTHVSKGAAIHSLVMNGFGKNIIQPITSEPIIVITKDMTPKVLIPAGTQIPCERIVIDDLVPNKEGQSSIELPICVGNAEKMLFNLKIKTPDNHGFHMNEQIKVGIEITADKLLVTDALCRNVYVQPEMLNPFANKELSGEERAVIKAEREVEHSASMNGGTPTKQSLNALIEAYKAAGNDFQAAETAELKNDYYPGSHNYNDIGVMYSNGGNSDKAIAAYRKGLERNPNNSTLYHNLAMQFKGKDRQQYIQYAQKAYEINPDDPIYTYEYGRVQALKGNKEEAERLYREAYEKYLAQWESGDMESWDYSWFASIANAVGEYDMARKVRQAVPKKSTIGLYNDENLTKSKDNLLERK